MNGSDFVARLQDEMRELFGRLGETETLESESDGRVDVVTLLKLALQSEMEASEIAALWMPTTPELDAKQVLAHQVGDEMKHYDLIARRLGELVPVVDRVLPLESAREAQAVLEDREQFGKVVMTVGDEAEARRVPRPHEEER